MTLLLAYGTLYGSAHAPTGRAPGHSRAWPIPAHYERSLLVSYRRLILPGLALLGIALFLCLTGGAVAARLVAGPPPGVARASCGPGAWTAQAAYPGFILDSAAAGYNGRLYSFGGYTGSVVSRNAHTYDPATQTWTPLALLPAPRAGAHAVTDGTYLYIVGGFDPNFSAVNTIWRYDPATDSYNTALAPLPSPGGELGVAYLAGQIYRVAGQAAPATGTNAVQIYTIATNTWQSVAPYPLAIEALASMATGGYLYAAGGVDATSYVESNKSYRYDPASDTWDDAAIADLPAPLYGPAAGLVNGRWVIAGGYHNAVVTAAAQAWDPPTNSWETLPALPHARGFLGGAAVGAALYALGGYDSNQLATTDNQQYLEPCSTPTPTAGPSATAAPTHTPAPAPATSTPAPAATATSTLVPSATATSTLVPSATASPVPSPPLATPCAIRFADVGRSDYFYMPVQYLACHGAVSGYSDGTFRPYNFTTRGQLAKVVALGFGFPLLTPTTPTFADVPATDVFYPYIETLAARQIISGYTDGLYRPGNSVTRGQLAKIVVGAGGGGLVSPPTPHFSDLPPSNVFYPYVETAVCRGLLSGYSDGTVHPGAAAYRGQIAKIVYNAVTAPQSCAQPTGTATPNVTPGLK